MFRKLVKWSKDHYSHLPWRVNRSVYGTLVSEIMLQQTTVGTVLNHFEKFITKYPSIEALAKISEDQILIDWKGLGYYRRAKNLLKSAKEIEEKYQGKIPLDYDSLISINGIGPYTANAILAMGADEKALCVDANLERVLARFYGISVLKGPKLQKEIYHLFEKGKIATELAMIGPRLYNEALMDLGRSICKARSASCEICPLAQDCLALKSGSALSFPVDIEGESQSTKGIELHLLRLIVEKNGKYLVYKKTDKQWLAGQYELPTFIIKTEDNELTQYPYFKKTDFFNLPSFKTSITKYKISNYVLHADESDLAILGLSIKNYEWKSETENFSTACLKALKF